VAAQLPPLTTSAGAGDLDGVQRLLAAGGNSAEQDDATGVGPSLRASLWSQPFRHVFRPLGDTCVCLSGSCSRVILVKLLRLLCLQCWCCSSVAVPMVGPRHCCTAIRRAVIGWPMTMATTATTSVAGRGALRQA